MGVLRTDEAGKGGLERTPKSTRLNHQMNRWQRQDHAIRIEAARRVKAVPVNLTEDFPTQLYAD